MEQSQSIKEIAIALCQFQSKVTKIQKSETNPFFKSKYANLSSILDVIREPLCENDLSFVQFPTGECELTTMIMHKSGEWIKGTYKMTPTKNDPQGLGSVITYQRRYALGAVLGLNIDEDGDGNKCSAPKKDTLNPSHLKWSKAKDALKNGSTTVEQIKANYYLSPENEKLLCQ